MKTKTFSNALGEIGDQYVSEAISYSAAKKKNSWMKWGAMAACLCLVVVGAVLPMVNNEPQPGQGTGEIMINTKNLDIYYVAENGTIESKNIEVTCTAEAIFNEWATLNGITDVTLIDCAFDNGAVENVKGDKDNPETPVEHKGTDYYTLTLTLSAEFKEYAESDNGNLLIDSLKETFYNYNHFDEFDLIMPVRGGATNSDEAQPDSESTQPAQTDD